MLGTDIPILPMPPTASGRFLSIAKAIGDVGAGGLIMLSAAAMESLSHFELPPSTVIMHMGEHNLKELGGGQPLYCVLHASLISRCVSLGACAYRRGGTASVCCTVASTGRRGYET